MRSSYVRLVGLAAIVILVILLAFYAAHHIENSESAKLLVEQFGVFGILILAVIGGLNVVVPIHAATFTPIFVAAGFSFPTIVLFLALGTTIADLISFAVGVWGRRATGENMTHIKEKLDAFATNHKKLILPGVFLYAALVPFPNEAILIPLGLMGFRFFVILVPLVLGTLVNQTIFALGFNSVFNLFF